jgi:energy-coupling factor transporter ATP-binding protein EcfA2
VPYRESSKASTLVRRLGSVPPDETSAFHIDIGHIIPANANTVLFELLIVGVLKSSEECQVYHRRTKDVFMLEIPNSDGDKTARGLKFCSLLPAQRLLVRENTLDLCRPAFTNPEKTKISCPEYIEMVFVCKFLRAVAANIFAANQTQFDPYTDAPITPADCFQILSQYAGTVDTQYSWGTFHTFLAFMYPGFTNFHSYGVFTTCHFDPDMEGLKAKFADFLIKTSKDFSMRSVPRGNQHGSMDKKYIGDEAYEAAAVADAADGAAADDDDDMDMPAPIGLRRQRSNMDQETREAVEAAAMNNPGLGEAQTNELANRFEQIAKWDQKEHPVVVWYESKGKASGLNFVCKSHSYVDVAFRSRRQLLENLKLNGIDLRRNWLQFGSDDADAEEAIQMLRMVDGSLLASRSTVPTPPPERTYVITVDNLLKMLSILLRVKNGIPVMIMGETGCGKSSLITQLMSVIRTPLRTLNIHGGMEDSDIIEWMSDRIVEAESMGFGERLIVFLDEVNTCNCMGLFKEIVCDHSMDGVILPDQMHCIAACNPYRIKKISELSVEQENMAGLVYEPYTNEEGDNVGTGIHDPLKNLVYRVHPLPESMIDHVFDFGALPANVEHQYIVSMLRRQVGSVCVCVYAMCVVRVMWCVLYML